MQKKRRAIRPKNKVDVREHANRLFIQVSGVEIL